MSESIELTAPNQKIRTGTPTNDKQHKRDGLFKFWRSMYWDIDPPIYVGSHRSTAYDIFLSRMDAYHDKEKAKYQELVSRDADVMTTPNHANYDELLNLIYRTAIRWGLKKKDILESPVFVGASEQTRARFVARFDKTMEEGNKETRARNIKHAAAKAAKAAKAEKVEHKRVKDENKVNKEKKKAEKRQKGESSAAGAASGR